MSSANNQPGLLLRAHVWFVAALIPLLVKVLPLAAILKLLTPRKCYQPYAKVPPAVLIEAVNRRLENPRNMKRRACLRKALTLYHFLRLGATGAVLRFGVYAPSPNGYRMHAHCWVTVDGEPVSPPPGEPAATVLAHREATDFNAGLSISTFFTGQQ